MMCSSSGSMIRGTAVSSSERDKMKAGEWYTCLDPDLDALRAVAATAVFEMTGGLRFSFNGNWAAPGNETSWTGAWRVVGERGTAMWDGAELHPGPPDRFLGLERALADFVDALRIGSVPRGECHDNLRSLAMCHAAVESAAARAPAVLAGGRQRLGEPKANLESRPSIGLVGAGVRAQPVFGMSLEAASGEPADAVAS